MEKTKPTSKGRAGPTGHTILIDPQPAADSMGAIEVAGSSTEATDKDKATFHVDRSLIPTASLEDTAATELRELGLDIFNQDDFEQGVIAQVDNALAREEEQRKIRIFEREGKSIEDDLKMVQKELVDVDKVLQSLRGATLKSDLKRLESVKRHKTNKLNQQKTLETRKKVLEAKIQGTIEMNREDLTGPVSPDISNYNKVLAIGNGRETEEESRIRRGEMTPFGTVLKVNFKRDGQSSLAEGSYFGDFLASGETRKKKLIHNKMSPVSSKIRRTTSSTVTSDTQRPSPSRGLKSKKVNFYDKRDKKHYRSDVEGSYCPKPPRNRKQPKLDHQFQGDPELSDYGEGDEEGEALADDNEYLPVADTMTSEMFGGRPQKKMIRATEAFSSDGSSSPGDEWDYGTGKRKLKRGDGLIKTRDDGEEYSYLMRIEDFEREEKERQRKDERDGKSESEDEEFEGGLKVPSRIWKKLYKYQKTCVRWLWELHNQQCGGIIGDEMGLGKTIQIIAYLAAVRQSKLPNKVFHYRGLGPTLVICPATVMHQWVKEFHTWWPPFRVAILHSTGSFTGKESDLVYDIVKANGVLITSYSSLVVQQDCIIPYKWHYVVLDEGHKIRNPDTQATLAVKQIKTPHRIILSGSPIQNNLKELWSLFDFVFPGKLGTLPDFMQNFAVPIIQGGYANANQVQVTTGYKCACVLRESINPYLLRRMKADVKIDLPDKSEQVLFCRLSKEQEDTYKEYLDSRECQNILAGRYQIFAGLITLRKICNHPDISTGGPRLYIGESTNNDETLEYGYRGRSGKMIVVESLLKLWKKQGHRCLLFSQSRAMLDILETFVKRERYIYMRMDGGTPIGSRQSMVNKFNQDSTLFLFLLTTRVGGLGVNLTGANRIIIFDPDWNPSTDTQARERAWRIGQKKQVTVYRLLTTGTIEEKIYHRQIFKQFMTNRVLKDPKQRRFFKSNDLYELFTLGTNEKKGETETSAIFAGTGSEVCVKKKKVNRFDQMKKEKTLDNTDETSFEEEEIQRMRKLAQRLSAKIKDETMNDMGDNSIKTEDEISSPVPAGGPRLKESKNGLSASIRSVVSSHRKKKRKKRKKDATFEGERIPHLDKLRDYKQPSAEEEKDKNKADDYVLNKLFKKGGIHSALQHDAIMNAGNPDYVLVEAEADRVAKQAVQALKKSRSQCNGPMSGVPNWTGHHGRPEKQRFGAKKNTTLLKEPEKVGKVEPMNSKNNRFSPRFGKKAKPNNLFDGTEAGTSVTGATEEGKFAPAQVMSSDTLIGKMLQRGLNRTDSGSSQLLTGIDPANYQLITDLRNFILFEGSNIGQATTQEILDFFGPRLPPSDSAKFKAMLNSICSFQKMDGLGFWRLNQEFR
ncbi:hypothetical protein ScPMuIL_004558 [Solemya velum]